MTAPFKHGLSPPQDFEVTTSPYFAAFSPLPGFRSLFHSPRLRSCSLSPRFLSRFSPQISKSFPPRFLCSLSSEIPISFPLRFLSRFPQISKPILFAQISKSYPFPQISESPPTPPTLQNLFTHSIPPSPSPPSPLGTHGTTNTSLTKERIRQMFEKSYTADFSDVMGRFTPTSEDLSQFADSVKNFFVSCSFDGWPCFYT